MIKLLFVLFLAMGVYGVAVSNAGAGLLALFCGACLYYFNSKMNERENAWRASPEAAKAQTTTDDMLDRHACECSCRSCYPKP
jgi:Na+-driven multidrug efflux pump